MPPRLLGADWIAGCRRRVPASRTVGADAIQGPQFRLSRPADAPFIAALFIASRRATMPWLPVLHDIEATVAFFRDVVPTRAEVWVEVDHIDATIGDGAPVALPLVRCAENPAPLPPAPSTKLRLLPVEPDGAREVYVVPTFDGKSQTFTESLTYQWVASAGGLSNGSTGGPRDVSGNPPPLVTNYKAPAARDPDGPTDVSLWIIQRDERLGVHAYEACVRVTP